MKKYRLSRNYDNDSYRLRISSKTKKDIIVFVAAEITPEAFESKPIQNTRFIRKIMVKQLNEAIHNPFWYFKIKTPLERIYYKISYLFS